MKLPKAIRDSGLYCQSRFSRMEEMDLALQPNGGYAHSIGMSTLGNGSMTHEIEQPVPRGQRLRQTALRSLMRASFKQEHFLTIRSIARVRFDFVIFLCDFLLRTFAHVDARTLPVTELNDDSRIRALMTQRNVIIRRYAELDRNSG
jgi:hypothetical protein